MPITNTATRPAELISHASDVLISLPVLEDLFGNDQRPYLAQLREWAELVIELAEGPSENLPRFAGIPLEM